MEDYIEAGLTSEEPIEINLVTPGDPVEIDLTTTGEPIEIDLLTSGGLVELELVTPDSLMEVNLLMCGDPLSTLNLPPGIKPWGHSHQYFIGEIVYYDGIFYEALAGNVGQQPDVTPLVWNVVSGGGGAVDSVNGQTGIVVLDATDVGADPAGSATTALNTANSYTDTEISALTFVETVTQGTGVTVDNTDPQNPIISSDIEGLPSGGATRQILAKNSPANYDTVWADVTYSQFVYDSTAVQEQNVYNDWADLVTAINNGQSGQKTITFRTNGDVLPAGTWNLRNTTFAGNGFPPAAGGVIIDLADGFVFDEVPSLKFESFIAFRSLSSTPIMTINGLTSIFMKENTIFSSTTSPFFSIGPGAFAIFVHDKGALFTDGGAPVLDLGASGNVVSAVIGGAVDFQPDTVIGGVGSSWQMYVYNDAPLSDIINVSQPSFFGTLDNLKFARADYVSYNNLTSGLIAEDVQAAIDEIIPLIPDIPDGTMVGDIPVWNGSSYEAEQLIIDAQPTKTTTLFDETTTPGVIYIGKALPTGSAISEAGAVWAIKTIDTTADTEIKWADGVTTYTKVWDDRASYSYF